MKTSGGLGLCHRPPCIVQHAISCPLWGWHLAEGLACCSGHLLHSRRPGLSLSFLLMCTLESTAGDSSSVGSLLPAHWQTEICQWETEICQWQTESDPASRPSPAVVGTWGVSQQEQELSQVSITVPLSPHLMMHYDLTWSLWLEVG